MATGEGGSGTQDTTKKIRTLMPDDLNIVWGNDYRYWNMGKTSEDEPYAEVNQVCWLEVTGEIAMEKPVIKGQKYAISFKMELPTGAFGWKGCPVFIMAKIGKNGRYKWKKINLLSELKPDEKVEIPKGNSFTVEVSDEFLKRNDDPVIYFGLYELWSGRWKIGLRIYQAKVEKI